MSKESQLHLNSCFFHHKIHLPDGTSTDGYWDFTECMDDILSGYNFDGKRVIDARPATGCISFAMEQKGADVTSFFEDVSSRSDQLIYPGCVRKFNNHSDIRLQNGYTYCYNKLKSKNNIYTGKLYDELPDDIGEFDVAVFNQALTQLRDPMLALMNVLYRVRDRVIIVDVFDKGKTHLMEASHIWWRYSLSDIKNMLKRLGFVLDGRTDICPKFKDEAKNYTVLMFKRLEPSAKKEKVSIITVAYDKDLEFLKYNLKSIKKFCSGYTGNIVVIDDHKNDCINTKHYLESIDQPFFVDTEAKHIHSGYVRQQWMKLFSDKYVPAGTNFVCHIDSDSVFADHHTPVSWFIGGKPIMLRTPYNVIFEHCSEKDVAGMKSWVELTSDALGFKVDHEYMRGMPLVYPVDIFKEVRAHIEKVHSCTLLEYLKDKPSISEYNIIGAYAYHYRKEDFYWITEISDRSRNDEYYDFVKARHRLMQHYSSRAIEQPLRYVDLNSPDNPISKLLDED